VLNSSSPYPLRLVSLQMVCNLFASPIFADKSLPANRPLRAHLIELAVENMLDVEHAPAHLAASSLALNLALADRRTRAASQDVVLLEEEGQASLAAALVEGVGSETALAESLRTMLTALGHLVFCRPKDSELVELLAAVDAATVVKTKESSPDAETKRLAGQVHRLLEYL